MRASVDKSVGYESIRAAKMNKSITCLMLSMVLATGCGTTPDGQSIDVHNEPSLRVSWEEYRTRAVRPPVDGKAIYALNGDEFTDSEEVLRSYFNESTDSSFRSKLAVWTRLSTGFEPVFVGANAVHIKYCISNQFGAYPPAKATVTAAALAAMQSWSAVANLAFDYVPALDSSCTQNTSGVDFAIVPSNNPSYYGCAANKMMAWANGPGCPLSGPISASAARGVLAVNPVGLPAHISLAGLLRHELGHVLAFRHEHPWAPGGCGGETPNHLASDTGGRRLTTYDQQSVMHYDGLCGKPAVDFTVSLLDGEGSRAVYGMPASWYGSAVLL